MYLVVFHYGGSLNISYQTADVDTSSNAYSDIYDHKKTIYRFNDGKFEFLKVFVDERGRFQGQWTVLTDKPPFAWMNKK